MASTTNSKLNGFMKESLGVAQARLDAFEKEANKVLKTVQKRSATRRKELDKLLGKLQPTELLESAKEKEQELVAAAGKVGENLVQRLNEVQEGILRFAGVASRDQVEDLMRELDKLSKKLEKLNKAQAAKAKALPAKTGTHDA